MSLKQSFIDGLVEGFIEAAAWSEDLEVPEEDARKVCEKFYDVTGLLVMDYKSEWVGHDLWLTARRHGAGFWDGDYGDELGDRLTDLVHDHFADLEFEEFVEL